MKLVFRTMFFLSIGFVSGCSWIVGEDGLFDTKQYDYTRAEITKELEVPASVGENNESDNYFVLETDEDLNGVIVGADEDVMAPMQVLTLGNKVRANRDSKNSSVYVTMSEIKLWDSIERYLNEEGIQVSSKDLSSSVLTTSWIKKDDDAFWSADITAWRQRYKIKLNEADRPSEIVLSVELLEAQEYINDSGKWQNVVNPGRLETEFLNSILGFLYVENIDRSRNLVNQSALGGISVKLGSNAAGDAALVTAAGYENVWGRIPVFLRLLNLTVEDQDRSQGLYFFKIEEDEGFFASLAFWSDDPETLDMPEGLYTIRVANLGERVTITFINDNNSVISAQVLAKNYPAMSKAFRSRVSE